ncbi:hypothetical protein, partial [Phaeobacter sp. B1627]|uniref:hypothetical protein n=1 Tax=Phaeobacter sp. B1627 TaxID=2583809 RepID=UPI00111A66C3
MIDQCQSLKKLTTNKGASWSRTLFRALAIVALSCLLTLGLVPVQAQAAFTDCPVNNVPSDPINLNLTDGVCTGESTADDPYDDDFIAIRANPAPLTEFELFDLAAGADTRDLIYSVSNGSHQGTLQRGGTTVLPNIDCSGGCVITGTHGGVAFPSFTYTQTGGSGTVGAAPASEAEIDNLT